MTHSTKCSNNYYIAGPGTATHDLVCNPLTSCNSSQTPYDLNHPTNGTATGDRICCMYSHINHAVIDSANGWPNTSGRTEECLVMSGTISIKGNFPPPLPLVRVESDLYVTGTNLTNLSMLGDLESVGWGINISDNPSLTTLAGLEQLEHISLDIRIANNPVLNSVAALNNLKTFGDPTSNWPATLTILSNPALPIINIFNGLTYLKEGEVIITDNAGLGVIYGFEQVEHLATVHIGHNNNLISILGFNDLKTLDGDDWTLVLTENPRLTNISGFSSLQSVSPVGKFAIMRNGSLCPSRATALAAQAGVTNLDWIFENFGNCL